MTREINDKKNLVNGFNSNVPESIYAFQGNLNGEIHLQWDAIDNAYHYVIETALEKSKRWEQIDIICDSHYVINGLKQGRIYMFRVAAVFADGQGPWSETVLKKVK